MRFRADLFLLLCTLLWGGTFIVTKLSLDTGISPILFVFIRFAVAAFLFFPAAIGELRVAPTYIIKRGIFLGVFLFLSFALQTIGLVHTSASRSAFLTQMLMVFTPILQMWFFRRLPTTGNIIGVVIALVGTFLLTSPDAGGFGIGEILTLGCAFLYAVYMCFIDEYTREGYTSLLTFLQIATTSVLALGFLGVENIHFELSLPLALGVLYLAIFATILTGFLQTRYQKDTTPSRAAVLFCMEPVFATIFAFLILDERHTTMSLLGCGLIILAVLVSEFWPGGRLEKQVPKTT